MLIVPQSGYCRDCEVLNAQDIVKEEQRLRAEAEEKARKATEDRRKAEEKRRIEEELWSKAEEERKLSETLQRRAEEARMTEEELQSLAEKARKTEEELRYKAEEHRIAEEFHLHNAEQERKAAEECLRITEEAQKAVEEQQPDDVEITSDEPADVETDKDYQEGEFPTKQDDAERRNDQVAQFAKIGETIKRILDRKNHLINGSKTNRFGQYGVGDLVQFGHYQLSPIAEDKEPIEWIILEIYQGRALLVSKDILDYKAYGTDDQDTANWADSAIRVWLNNEFIEDAFTDEQQDIILTISNDDWENCTFYGDSTLKRVNSIDSCVTSDEKVFLLSIAEACKTDLSSPHMLSLLQNTSATQYAESKQDFSTSSLQGWWLRSSGEDMRYAVYGLNHSITSYHGYTSFEGTLKSSQLGIRPAIWIDTHAFERPITHDDGSAFRHLNIEKSHLVQKDETAEEEKVIINSFYTKLAGVTFHNEGANTESRQRIIRDLSRNGLLDPGQRLELRPDPQNRFDHQAVAVYGPDGRQMGFLPKEIAHRIFAKLNAAPKSYALIVSAVTGGDAAFSYGVNVRIEEYQFLSKPVVKPYSAEDADDDYEEAMRHYRIGKMHEAFSLLQRAAEFGLADAQYQLGCCYDYGRGTDIDSELASYWYLKAAEQGHASAQGDLAYNYNHGIGVAVDHQKALYWLQKAVAQGEPNAMVLLGGMYEHGTGVRQDDEEAFELYKQAAELGDVNGAHNTGIAYLIGRGVTRDPYEAAKWNTYAAEQGHKNAQFNLARQYLNGDGVPQNADKAIYWMTKSAENGHPQAIALLQHVGDNE